MERKNKILIILVFLQIYLISVLLRFVNGEENLANFVTHKMSQLAIGSWVYGFIVTITIVYFIFAEHCEIIRKRQQKKQAVCDVHRYHEIVEPPDINT